MEKLIELEFQKREEIVNTFDKNYLLEAGAGAGKTTIIVERIINHIISEKIEAKNIVAITFTKAASLELAERIEREALEYLSKEKDKSTRENLERVEELFSGTIHSFCEMLLREMPFEAGLTPGYEIVEDSNEFYEKIWYEFLRNNKDKYKEYIDLFRLFNIDYRDLKQGAISVMDNPDINFVGFDLGIDYEELKDRFKSLDKKALNTSFIKQGSNLGKLFVKIIEEGGDLNKYISDLLKECPKINSDDDLTSKYIYKKHQEKDEAKDIVDFIEKIIEIYSSLNAIIYNICTEFVNLVGEYKEVEYTNYLTFNDLLFKACKLIKTSKKAREHFRGKFKYFYIDEAQDTDPLQAELLLLLSHDGDIEDLKSFTDVNPKAGSLFIVADPKQSIYRFRRADISIYESVKGVIDRFGEVVNLDINFRSTNGICKWVEKTFKDRSDGFAFLEEASDTQAGFKGILNFWKEDEKEDSKHLSGVYKYETQDANIDEEEIEKDKETQREVKEEEYIANLVRDIIDTKYIDEKIGRDEFTNRRVENKDIMILTKTNEETGIFLDELKRNNIPALLAGEKRLSDNREVLNLFLLLDFLIDPRDDIKFVAVLRNCFYLEVETVNLLFNKGKKANVMFNDEEFKRIDHPHLKESIAYLKEIFTKSKYEDPIIFIEKLIKEKIGIYDTHKEYSEIEKRDGHSSLVQTVELLKSKGAISLYGIKEELKELIDNKINYELPVNLNFAQNAVRVMNIHKSKGLEANIVILVGWDKKRTLMPDSYHVEKIKDENIGYIVCKSKTLVKSPEEKIRKDKEKEFKDAELDRLIYVASTRAKSVLILPAIEDEKMFLYPLNKEIDKKLYLKEPNLENKKEILSNRKIEEMNLTKEIDIKRKISKASYEKLSPSTYEKKNSFKSNYNTLKEDFVPRGKIYGTIVHKVFEIILKDIVDINDILKSNIDYAIKVSIKESLDSIDLDKEILESLVPKNEFNLEIDKMESIKEETTKFLSENLKKMVDSFIDNEIVVDVFSNAKLILTEFPFYVALDSTLLDLDKKEEVLSLVSGEMDLLVQGNDDNFTIIDYKTDIVDENSIENLKERYSFQLESYKKSLQVVLKEKNMKVDDVYIYSTYLQKMINLKKVALA
ncbi:MAG: UvrD-helicase domain-containing protein [Tissierella sp.]|uniref:UvrD-helicase domain-containing protein n=1 Tax=Tissierella sp. TaxID=41274 RepID=UPI003F966EF2